VDDFPEIVELLDRAYRHDGVPRSTDLEELEEELDDVAVVRATDTRVAEIGGAIVGYAYTIHLPSELREERSYVFGEVDPQFRRRGVGTALMQWALPRAEVQLRSSGRTLPRYIRTDRFDYLAGAHALFDSLGMRPVRYMEELLRPLADLPPLHTPAGTRIVPWPVDRDEEIRVEKNLAFADHWGSTPTSPLHWAGLVRGFGARPDLSFIAVDDDDRVVAHCLNHRYPSDDAVTGRSDAWIDSLGTLPAWRGKGVGSALVAHSLHAFASAGLTHASIGVDSENPSGAAQLYRRLGFTLQQRSITHEIALA
jgi:mycothiol synthase